MDDDEDGGDVKDEKLWIARGGFGQSRSSNAALCAQTGQHGERRQCRGLIRGGGGAKKKPFQK